MVLLLFKTFKFRERCRVYQFVNCEWDRNRIKKYGKSSSQRNVYKVAGDQILKFQSITVKNHT